MKKIFSTLFVLYIFYFLAQIGFNYLSNGHTVNYDIIDNNYLIEVNEIFRSKLENDDNNYSLNFNIYGDEFHYLVYDDFKNTSKIVKDVKYYIDPSYSCLFVKYKDNKILSDIVCKNNNTYYTYTSIAKPTDGLKKFVDSLKKEGYDQEQFKDNIEDTYSVNNILVYKNNYDNDHLIGLSIDKHFYKLALNIKNEYEKLYVQEIDNYLEYFINDYYIYADYSTSPIRKLFIQNYVNGEKRELGISNISESSYFVGHRQHLVYLYDPTTHIEYEINPVANTVIEAGNQDTSIKYFHDGRWITTTYDKFEVENIRFDEQYKADLEDNRFEKIYKFGNEYGYYYMAKKINNGYAIYRSTIMNSDKLTYLFNTDDYKSLRFIKDYVYYKKGNQIKAYNDKKGNRIILENNIFDSYYFDYHITFKKQEN